MNRAETRTRSTTVSIPWIVGLLGLWAASCLILSGVLYLAGFGLLTTLQMFGWAS